jgi:hypothetical protein
VLLAVLVFSEASSHVPPTDKFTEVQRELVARRRWVIDGNYNSTLPVRLEACDTVVLMDVSTVATL